MANSPEELAALDERYRFALEKAEGDGLGDEVRRLSEAIDTSSGVVVSMPASAALILVGNDMAQYVNYEKLVGSGARSPATFASDAHRRVVAGALFGSFGEEISYGALSLSGRGLATYGDVYLRLKRVALEDRTTFLETNSFDFIKKYGDTGHPPGYRADWDNRNKLTVVKLLEAGLVKKGDVVNEWEKRILICDGKNRAYDQFIEAHIYGTFTVFSIEKIVASEHLSKEARPIVDAVVNAFERAHGR